jgi:hypothetical protein
MSRASQIVIVVLLVAVLAFGALIVMRKGRVTQPQRDPSQVLV